MEKLLIHEYKIKAKGVKRKVIYQFSDVHFNCFDVFSSDEEKKEVDRRIQNWLSVRKKFAVRYQEPYGEEQQIPAAEHLENLMAEAGENGDALIIAGDLFDYVNSAHLRFFEKRFSNVNIPYLFVSGNHEKPCDIPDESFLAFIKKPIQTLDLGDMILVGVNNSQRVITAEQISGLKTLLASGKPLMLAMHIPIQAEHNAIHMACDEYYRMNYPGAPAENFEFIDLIQQNADKMIAVCAGHLHFLNVCELVPGLTQYVSSQGVTGHINRYVIGE